MMHFFYITVLFVVHNFQNYNSYYLKSCKNMCSYVVASFMICRWILTEQQAALPPQIMKKEGWLNCLLHTIAKGKDQIQNQNKV